MSESQDEAMVRSIARECEQLVVGMFPYIPLDRVRWLLAYGERLQTENAQLKENAKAMHQRLADYMELRAENEQWHAVAHAAGDKETGEGLLGVGKELLARQSEIDRLRAENEKHKLLWQEAEKRVFGADMWVRGTQEEMDKLRAENEKLSTRVTELEVGEACFTPSGVDELRRLRAENEKLTHVVDEQRKTGETVYPLSEGMDMVRELQRLRATALTASEAEAIEDRINEGSVFTSQQAAYDSGMEKVYQIAHPEPQEGSNG